MRNPQGVSEAFCGCVFQLEDSLVVSELGDAALQIFCPINHVDVVSAANHQLALPFKILGGANLIFVQ